MTGFVCSRWPIRQEVHGTDGLGRSAHRGPPVDRRFLGDRTSLLEGPGSGCRPTLGREHFSLRPPGLATFPAGARYQCEEGSAEGGSTVLTAEEGMQAWWARKGLTRKGPEVTVRSTSPSSGGLCWASWRQSETGGGAVYAEPRSRWSTRPGDGSDTQGEIPGNAWRCNQRREEVDAESEDGAMTSFQTAHGPARGCGGVAVAIDRTRPRDARLRGDTQHHVRDANRTARRM